MKKLVALLSVLVVAVAPLLVAAPADSAAFPWKATITFDKNPAAQFNSKVIWRLYQRQAGAWKLVETKSWRAGAGLPRKGGKNPCIRNTGWLPNGTYRFKQHNNYPGNKIHGRAFHLDNKACGNGTVRRDLFLHSEQGPGNRQCRNRRGDQLCRWEWPRINDYKSFGCIKMSPGDLAQLTYLFRKHFASGVRYPADRVALRVIG